MKHTTCDVTCGDGFEMWTRKCESPTPAYGGHNCSKRGEGEKWKSCRKTPCKYVLTGILNYVWFQHRPEISIVCTLIVY